MNINTLLKAARLRTLPLALSCTLVGSALALSASKFDLSIFLLAMLTTALLQVLSNFANDYGDYLKGTDQNAKRKDRVMTSGELTLDEMKIILATLCLGSFLSGITLLYLSFTWEQIYFLGFMLGIGLSAIWAALKYTTGKNPYGYKGFGDLFVFLFFGLVGVIGTYFLYDKSVELVFCAVLLAISIGGFSTSVLNLNNMRDIITDEESNKITIPVRLGLQKAKIYHVSLLLVSWLSLFMYLMNNLNWVLLALVLPFILQIKHIIFVLKTEDHAQFDGELRKIAISTFFISVIIFLTQVFFRV